MKRNCSVCGAELDIRVAKDRSYNGGHYFGEVKTPIKGAKEFEYWECDRCFHEGEGFTSSAGAQQP